jgi:RNA polymerase primary sigma factor
LAEINREYLLTVDEEVELTQRIRKGDEEALKKLTSANLRLVTSIARRYQNQGLSLPDLINEGNLGLKMAAQLWDETRRFSFISYAFWWIRQFVLHALADQSRIERSQKSDCFLKLPMNGHYGHFQFSALLSFSYFC